MANEKLASHGCKPRPMKNKHCKGFGMINKKQALHVRCVRVLKVYKVENFGWSQFPLRFWLPTVLPCTRTLPLSLFYYSPSLHKLHRWLIKIYDYIHIHVSCCWSRRSGILLERAVRNIHLSRQLIKGQC